MLKSGLEEILKTLNTIFLILIFIIGLLIFDEVKEIKERILKDFPVVLKIEEAKLRHFVLREGETVKVESIDPFKIELGDMKYILPGIWEYRKENIIYLIRNRLNIDEKLKGIKIEEKQ